MSDSIGRLTQGGRMNRTARALIPAICLILGACGGDGTAPAPAPTTVVSCASTDPVCPVGSLTLGFSGVAGSPTITPSSPTTTISTTSSSQLVSGTTSATTNGYWLIVINDQLRAWGVLPVSGGSWSADIPIFCGMQQVTYTFDAAGARSYFRTSVTQTGCTAGQFRVQLSWDTGPSSDIDLHLLRPSGAFGDTDDCYFANCQGTGLEWGAAGAAGNPLLDVDDTEGWGPENIVIGSGAESGEYRIIVHNFDESPATRATVKVYLNEIEQQRLTSLTLDFGLRDYWDVARVNVLSGAITTVNTYSTSAPALVAGSRPGK